MGESAKEAGCAGRPRVSIVRCNTDAGSTAREARESPSGTSVARGRTLGTDNSRQDRRRRGKAKVR